MLDRSKLFFGHGVEDVRDSSVGMGTGVAKKCSRHLLKEMEGPLLTVWPVLTEAFYLLNFSWKAQDNLWEFLARGGMEIADLQHSDRDRCRALMNKYRDLQMDMADAALVSIAEARKIRSVFTLDHKDFSVYNLSHIKRLELIPEELS